MPLPTKNIDIRSMHWEYFLVGNVLPNTDTFKKQAETLHPNSGFQLNKKAKSHAALHSINSKNELLFINTEEALLHDTEKPSDDWTFSLLVAEMKICSIKLFFILHFELHDALLTINQPR